MLAEAQLAEVALVGVKEIALAQLAVYAQLAVIGYGLPVVRVVPEPPPLSA